MADGAESTGSSPAPTASETAPFAGGDVAEGFSAPVESPRFEWGEVAGIAPMTPTSPTEPGEAAEPVDAVAVAAIVFAVLVAPVGLVLAVWARRRAARAGRRGRLADAAFGIAVAAVALGVAFWIVYFAVLAPILTLPSV